MSARRLGLVGVVGVAGLLGLAACGVQAESEPREIIDGDIEPLSVRAGSDAGGAERIYLVEPGDDQLLRSVSREAASPQELIESLLRGPNPIEAGEDFTSAIPREIRLLSIREQGSLLVLDLTAELTELTGTGLVPALAQIVYTASEIDGVESVQITIDGQPITWPTGNRDTTAGPLRVYDYPNLVRTAQPAYPSVPSNAAS